MAPTYPPRRKYAITDNPNSMICNNNIVFLFFGNPAITIIIQAIIDIIFAKIIFIIFPLLKVLYFQRDKYLETYLLVVFL